MRKIYKSLILKQNLSGGSEGKASAYNAGNPGSTPVLGRSSGEGNGNPLQYLRHFLMFFLRMIVIKMSV